MATKNWISEAVSHPGAATAAAKKAGMSVPEWAQAHQNDSGVTGQRARLALNFEGMARKKAVMDRLKK